MTFVNINPTKEFENLTHNLQRYFNDFSTTNHSSCEEYTPRVDVSEDENNIFIEAEIPGVNKKDIKLTVKNNVLTLEGEKKKAEEVEGMKFYRRERVYGEFKRSFKLPKHVDTNSIKAVHQDGTIAITLNKVVPEEAKLKEIEIN